MKPIAFLRSLAVATSLVLATSAHAQVAKPEALPVWNGNGKLEAVLLIEPMSARTWQFGNTRLETALGVDRGETLGIVCGRKNGLGSAIGNLADNCLLASVNSRDARQASAGASVARPGSRFGFGLGNARETLPAWLAPSGRSGTRVNQNALTLFGEKNIGREATISIGGTLARARLVSPESVPSLSDRWDIRTIDVGASVGRFGANVIGRVVDSPLQPGTWQGLGLGLSWRTPWSGQLSVGADNVVTRGKNPFAPNNGANEDDTVPYVRYQQDL